MRASIITGYGCGIAVSRTAVPEVVLAGRPNYRWLWPGTSPTTPMGAAEPEPVAALPIRMRHRTVVLAALVERHCPRSVIPARPGSRTGSIHDGPPRSAGAMTQGTCAPAESPDARTRRH